MNPGEVDNHVTGSRAAHLCAALAGGVLAAAVVIGFFPWLQDALEFNRGAIMAGQWWRVLTCHFVHWSWGHLAGDISAVIGLIWLIRERLAERWFLPAALGVLAFAGASVFISSGDIYLYRGMSGINHAVLGWVLVVKISESAGIARRLSAGALFILFAKIFCESHDIFCLGTGLPDGIRTVATVHAAGLLAGVAMGIAPVFLKKFRAWRALSCHHDTLCNKVR